MPVKHQDRSAQSNTGAKRPKEGKTTSSHSSSNQGQSKSNQHDSKSTDRNSQRSGGMKDNDMNDEG
jgi:hypothetical protein